jgi:hypothetical protein
VATFWDKVLRLECSGSAFQCLHHQKLLVLDFYPDDPVFDIPPERFWKGSSLGHSAAIWGWLSPRAIASGRCKWIEEPYNIRTRVETRYLPGDLVSHVALLSGRGPWAACPKGVKETVQEAGRHPRADGWTCPARRIKIVRKLF